VTSALLRLQRALLSSAIARSQEGLEAREVLAVFNERQRRPLTKRPRPQFTPDFLNQARIVDGSRILTEIL
jgi:hypothetical protein